MFNTKFFLTVGLFIFLIFEIINFKNYIDTEFIPKNSPLKTQLNLFLNGY